MSKDNKQQITIETIVEARVDLVWEAWTQPAHIVRWNHATDDWHTTNAANDLRTGGKFVSRMEAKDGSMGFDFGGVYTDVVTHRRIEYAMEDGREVRIDFDPVGHGTKVVQCFEAEETNDLDVQRAGWQAILDNFKKYTESI